MFKPKTLNGTADCCHLFSDVMAACADREYFKDQVDLLLLPYPIYRKYVDSERQCYSLIARKNSYDDYEVILSGSFEDGFPEVIDQSDTDYLRLLNHGDRPISSNWHEGFFKYIENAPAHFIFSLKTEEVELFAKNYPGVFSQLFTKQPDGNFYLSGEKARYLARLDFDTGARMNPRSVSGIQIEEASPISPAIGMRSGSATLDMVPCLKCDGWPTVAKEWIDRPRNWPEETLFNKLQTKGFYIVPKPSGVIGNTQNEWRISFSELEADLLQNLNDVQARVYYILRCFYVRYLKSELKDTISSYHLKTGMFWMLAKKRSNEWKEENISSLVLEILQQLLEWYVDQFLPHYFIREHNLLYGLSSSSIKRVISVFGKFTSNLSDIIDENIVNSKYIGLLPRLGVLNVDVQIKLNMTILQKPSDDAYKLLTVDRESLLAKHIEFDCRMTVLKHFRDFLIHSNETAFVAQIFAPCLLQGVVFLAGSSNMAVFMEQTCKEINAAAVTVVSLCYHILLNQKNGSKRLLFLLAKLSSILNEEYLPPIYNAVIDAIAGFMVTVDYPMKINYTNLDMIVEESLTQYDSVIEYKTNKEQQMKTFPLPHMFLLAGGLCCKVATLR